MLNDWIEFILCLSVVFLYVYLFITTKEDGTIMWCITVKTNDGKILYTVNTSSIATQLKEATLYTNKEIADKQLIKFQRMYDKISYEYEIKEVTLKIK